MANVKVNASGKNNLLDDRNNVFILLDSVARGRSSIVDDRRSALHSSTTNYPSCPSTASGRSRHCSNSNLPACPNAASSGLYWRDPSERDPSLRGLSSNTNHPCSSMKPSRNTIRPPSSDRTEVGSVRKRILKEQGRLPAPGLR